ncbi:BPL-N domain-containing protein [Oceanidesulfovibrio marinus]|uniref:Biotin--protein ligase n=1 Tax=Oceanidesulfovibrio marinus TaxID=370038 RepID=A0ABX6NIS3_9BACT|nr:BPL-N domain-containing protein [Oceanidesulfovibrio marinus]QJT10563.1 biotin--protein ligase [Oceanidesulfovibrio marinus]
MAECYILWDESYLWGLLAWRAVDSFGIPYRLVKAQDIAQGLLSSNPPAVLLVPGGVARRKAERLGKTGMAEVRNYIESGGTYIGFCGGSGLGLTGRYGLGICPWTRAAMRDRMLHLISGHIHVSLSNDGAGLCHGAFADLIPADLPEEPLLPVWWPARFASEPATNVGVLAHYDKPGDDFWIADLPIASLPSGTFQDWEQVYGLTLKPDFIRGQPCIVAGTFGKGRYVLSYAHLETPASPQANGWLAHILATLTGETPLVREVPPWNLCSMPAQWEHPLLDRAGAVMRELLDLGRDHFLLFDRNDWLLGWRAGIPGSHLNHLCAMLQQCRAMEPSDEAIRVLEEEATAFERALTGFHDEVSSYLLAERLAMTLSRTYPDAVSQKALQERREAIFGQAMEQSGLYADLLSTLDRVLWRQMRTGS